jgi:hypothetical protein
MVGSELNVGLSKAVNAGMCNAVMEKEGAAEKAMKAISWSWCGE